MAVSSIGYATGSYTVDGIKHIPQSQLQPVALNVALVQLHIVAYTVAQQDVVPATVAGALMKCTRSALTRSTCNIGNSSYRTIIRPGPSLWKRPDFEEGEGVSSRFFVFAPLMGTRKGDVSVVVAVVASVK